MRLKDYPEREGKRVWLSESELQLLIDQAKAGRETVAIILAGRAGLRRDEIVQIQPADIVDTGHGQVIRVWSDYAKQDKYREVPLPEQLSGIHHGATPGEPLVDCADTTVYDFVKRARAGARAETRDEGWQYVGPHDLRRSWGVRLLESGVLPSVVMEFGGWADWQTFRDHYLAEFSPEALRRERGKVGWLSGGQREGGSGGSTPGYAAVDSGSSQRGER